MNIKQYTDINRHAWNQATPLHQKAAKKYWDEFFFSGKAEMHSDLVLNQLRTVGINNKDVAHLCCNNGVELLSFKQQGARKCIGFDICDLAIIEAQERARLMKSDVEYIRSDVYDISSVYHNSFDLVFLSIGTLRWLPDLFLFFQTVHALLRNQGKLFICEMHPFTEIINDDRDLNLSPLLVTKSYFQVETIFDEDSLDYVGRTQGKGEVKCWFMHTMSQIITKIIENKMQISFFHEYEQDIAGIYKLLTKQSIKVPLSFMLIGEK